MQTVISIIDLVYDGSTADAAKQLGVGASAVWNWKTWGYFPARLASPIFQHARTKGVELDIADIPVMGKFAAKRADAGSDAA